MIITCSFSTWHIPCSRTIKSRIIIAPDFFYYNFKEDKIWSISSRYIVLNPFYKTHLQRTITYTNWNLHLALHIQFWISINNHHNNRYWTHISSHFPSVSKERWAGYKNHLFAFPNAPFYSTSELRKGSFVHLLQKL